MASKLDDGTTLAVGAVALLSAGAWAFGRGGSAARRKRLTDDQIEDKVQQDLDRVRSSSVGELLARHGALVDVRTVLIYLHAHEQSWTASFFMDSLLDRKMRQFYIDDRAYAGTAKMGARKVTNRDVIKAIRDLRAIPELSNG